MKILFVSLMHGFPWGGSEELWCKVANEALDENNEVIISATQWESIHPKLQQLIDKGAKFYWRKPHQAQVPSLSFRIVSKVKRTITRERPDKPWNWILNERPDRICINMGGPYEVLHYPALVTLLNDEKIPYFLIQQFNFENVILNNIQRTTAKKIFTGAKKVFFVSQRNKETTERNLVTHLNNAEVISNPANLFDYNAIEFPVINDTCLFASVARLDAAFKGQDILLETLSSDKWKGRNWKLNLYGAGPDEEYLKELITFYGLGSKVHLKGTVSNIKEIWAINHLLLMPSAAEGTPLALIEAMLCGRPAVVTDVGGNAFLTDDNITGFVAASNTVNLLDEAMERAWGKKEGWKMMGEKARISVLIKVNLQSHKDIYKEINTS